MPEALSRTYARFVSSLEYEHLPPEVTDKLKASLLHAMVVSIIGAQTSHGQAAIVLAKEEEGRDSGATILVDGSRATRGGAAFANSKLMHATNQTDSYRMLIHPGPCIIPAGLASGELGGKTGADLLTAMAAGYEVEARIAGGLYPDDPSPGFPVQSRVRHTGSGRDHRQALGAQPRPDGYRPGPRLHFRRRHHRGSADERPGDALPRAQRHPERHNGGPLGP